MSSDMSNDCSDDAYDMSNFMPYDEIVTFPMVCLTTAYGMSCDMSCDMHYDFI